TTLFAALVGRPPPSLEGNERRRLALPSAAVLAAALFKKAVKGGGHAAGTMQLQIVEALAPFVSNAFSRYAAQSD
ncbi:MAG TPA: hypothetical protein VJG32_17105, partial [Anaerolineae bacterium]|nr:hypothetical protein [Anaerolineae bacterium]